jgi:hypothetical protein
MRERKMKIQQAKDLYDLADEGEEKTDAKLALKRELQKEVPSHEDMLAKVKANSTTNPSSAGGEDLRSVRPRRAPHPQRTAQEVWCYVLPQKDYTCLPVVFRCY